MGYKFTEDADVTLDAVLLYITSDNSTAALRVYDMIIETCEMLSEIPEIGKTPDYSDDPALLYFPVKKYNNYLIFYRKQKKHIEIVDIIHGARDLPALFHGK